MYDVINVCVFPVDSKAIGFTSGLSPSWGSLMLTDAINESKDNQLPTYTAELDVQKAFDTVWHDSLLKKLPGIPVLEPLAYNWG